MLQSNSGEELDTIWINLREEPSMYKCLFKLIYRYINGDSFVLRKKEEPFKNLFNNESVVTKSKVENMEKRLKKDVLIECHIPANRGNIVVHSEEELHLVSFISLSNIKLSPKVLHVHSESLLTTREMFYLASIKEYNIKYYRIPIIENNPPSLVFIIISLHFS